MTNRCPDRAKKFVPIQYRIATAGVGGWETVSGYAFELPRPFHRLRFCVRFNGRDWAVDHYDSGMGVFGPVMNIFEERKRVIAYVKKWRRDDASRTRIVRWLLRYLKHSYRNGHLREAMRAAGYGWCLKKAGL